MTVVSLLDVNLLIALAWPNHVHHRTALRWFDRNRKSGWATCPLTQSGFVRVSSNAHILPGARSPREALALLRRIVELPNHVFWQDDFSIATSDLVDETKLLGHRQITDAHLLAVALRGRDRRSLLAFLVFIVIAIAVGDITSGGAISGQLFGAFLDRFQSADTSSLNGRSEIWAQFAAAFSRSPLVGIGYYSCGERQHPPYHLQPGYAYIRPGHCL